MIAMLIAIQLRGGYCWYDERVLLMFQEVECVHAVAMLGMPRLRMALSFLLSCNYFGGAELQVTIFRDPVPRVLSCYSYRLVGKLNSAPTCVADVPPERQEPFHNNMVLETNLGPQEKLKNELLGHACADEPFRRREIQGPLRMLNSRSGSIFRCQDRRLQRCG